MNTDDELRDAVDAYFASKPTPAAPGDTLPDPATCARIRIMGGLSQRKMALLLRIPQSTLGMWEMGERKPRPESATRWLLVLTLIHERVTAR